MYTRCPGCQSVYALDAKGLAEAAGVVRCGHCGKTFNSLSTLFEDHPRADDPPLSGAGMPPMLDFRAIVQPELPGVNLVAESAPKPDLASAARQDTAATSSADVDSIGPTLHLPPINSRNESVSPTWTVASFTLALILATQLTFLVADSQSSVRALFFAGQNSNVSSDPAEVIQITSRDMHRHPTLDDAVIVSATLRNRSDGRLAWPVLEVRLFDASQQILGVRRLYPQDYLVNPDNAELGMPTDLIVPVIIEFVVGTTLPSGFDFRFY